MTFWYYEKKHLMKKKSVDYLEILCILTILKVGEVNTHLKLQQLSGLLAMQNQHRTLNPIKILGIYEADELEHGQQAILMICITIP